jgi:hypothetical protein
MRPIYLLRISMKLYHEYSEKSKWRPYSYRAVAKSSDTRM